MTDELDISPEGIRALIEVLAKPIDFESLETEGLLKKEGSWYRLINPKDLPEHVSRKIIEIKTDDSGTLAKFESEKPYQKMKDRFN